MIASPGLAAGQHPDTTFRIHPQRTTAELRSLAAVAEPPHESGDFRVPDLVDLMTMDAPIIFDIRYASTNNFMGMAFYDEPRAFLQRPAAEALKRAAEQLSEQGYGLIVFDAYRPWFVTKMFWEATPDSLRHFVAFPGEGSRHNRGAAVDVGLYHLQSDEPARMPSGYDEFTPRAHANFAGGSEEARRLRDLLRTAMEANGFRVYAHEWWHYDHADWRQYPIMNVPFDRIGKASRPER